MDEQGSPIASSVSEPRQDTSPKKRHGCFYYGCLTTVLLVLVAVGGLFFLFQYGNSSVTPVVEEFLKAAEGADYDHAYAMLGDGWKQKITREEFPALFKQVHDTLGSRRSLSMRGIKLQTTTAGTFARASYAASYDKGEAELNFALEKKDGQWLIAGLLYNSPELIATLKCPNCGAVNSFDAKFCSKCGKPLHQ
jgi:uncharacterized membrane protein YvbJ